MNPTIDCGNISGNKNGYAFFNFRKAELWLRFYIARVLYDFGSIRNKTATYQYYKMLAKSGIKKPLFAWFGEAGVKLRTNGNTNFVSKVYTLFGSNDAVQITDLSQPYLAGNIAPNERLTLKNPNGGSRYLTHPTISFTASDAWSVTTVLNWNGGSNSNIPLFGADGLGELRLKSVGNFIRFINDSIVGVTDIVSTNILIGKATILTFVAKGDGILTVYRNGSLFTTITNPTNFSFNRLLTGIASVSTWYDGSISAHIIRSGALTQSQITNEYNFFRSIYPEIPTVTITDSNGTNAQTWATSNLDVVTTPQGNIIPEVQSNATWATSAALYDAAYAAKSGTVEQKTYAGVKAAAMWSYYSNDPALGVIYGKLYNWYAAKLLQMDIDFYNTANPTTPFGYKVPATTDFNQLANNLGGSAVAGGKLKKDGLVYWTTPNSGADNSSGFSALGSGRRTDIGNFNLFNNVCIIWSLTNQINTCDVFYLNNADSTGVIVSGSQPLRYGNQIRLIKV